MAHGLTMTGAIDWYIGKLLGVPKNSASAQLRLVCSVCFASAFLNNTPIVALMIPIVLRWAKTIRISAQQLLIPMSYGTIMGGTCTLIGTSTNLVLAGMLEEKHGIEISLFDITPYGVPVALMGIAYLIIFGPILLPGRRSGSGGSPFDGDEILLGARITPWSPAAGRSVKRSGLRDTGGLYLVSVWRAATGNTHRAVGPEFVLNVNDVIYFSGLIEGFGEFCHEHGLDLLTNESLEAVDVAQDPVDDNTVTSPLMASLSQEDGNTIGSPNRALRSPRRNSVEDEHLRCINHMTGMNFDILTLSARCKIHSHVFNFLLDIIQGIAPVKSTKVNQIDIVIDNRSDNRLVLVGINARDRPGLLLDISKCLLRLDLQLHRTEAAVLEERSVSVWRCTYNENIDPDEGEVRAKLNVSLSIVPCYTHLDIQ